MQFQNFHFRFGPNDGERIAVPLPAPARLIFSDSGEIIDVSKDHLYPCYVRYLVEHEGAEHHFYEYEGELPLRA